MLNSESLSKCYDIISRLDESSPLWLPNYFDVRNLSFISKNYDKFQWKNEKDKSGVIYDLIETHDDFNEYILYLEKRSANIISNEDVVFLNKVLSIIFSDRHISKSLVISNISIIREVNLNRYIKFMVLSRLTALIQNSEKFDYWQKINEFSEAERLFFNGRPFKFHKSLVSIMFGYFSGGIRDAYANGAVLLNKYEKLLMELCAIEKESIFRYFPGWRGVMFNGDVGLSYALKKIEEARSGLVSTRNDDSLAERGLVIELLKLFRDHGNSKPTAAVYKFTRSGFLINDVERKTIQRCWDSLQGSGQK